MICPNCQAEAPGNATRCPQCGVGLPRSQNDQQTIIGTVTPPPPPTADPDAVTLIPASMSRQASSFARTPAPGASLRLEPGDDFGPRYRIEALIGEGGMGKVFKAYDKDLDRVVALKLVRAELASDPDSMQRFKQELLLASKISHKNILRIHDLGDVEGMKFISMTYVEGEDLYDVIRREGRLPVDRAVTIVKQLCGALEAAHNEGVVHRDLKPRNILIDRNDNVYVSDFGLAKSLESGASAMTRTGDIVGTPRYMSPEQAEALPTDHRSDLYALGLILYEMVTGDLPFRGDSMLQMMYQRVTQPPRNPQTLVPDLPDSLTAILMRCLEKDPARRYQSARGILQDLESGRATPPSEAGGASLAAMPPVSAPPAREVKSKPKGWLIGSGATALAIAVAMAIPSVRNMILRKPSVATEAPAAQKYMAILPFRALGDDALKYQAEGVVESLSAKLFQLKNVHLASATAVGTASSKDPVDKVARNLGVTLILQGTVQGAGDKISVTVTLEDVAAKKTVWSQEFSGLRQDLLTLEDDIYNKLVAALELKLGNEELARGATRPTEDVGAYNLYLHARNMARGSQDSKVISAALDVYDEAIKKDAGFALAYSGVADAHIAMYNSTKDNAWLGKALGAAQQAQRLNDNLPEVHFSLGGVYVKTGKTAEAISELQRAIELAPNSDEGYRRLGAAYLAGGRKEESIQAYEKAVEVNPYYPVNHAQLGIAYWQYGDNEKALTALRKVIQLDPDNASAYSNIGVVFFRQGKWSECVPAFQKSLELKPSGAAYSNLGAVYIYQGNYLEAVKMFEKAVEMNPKEQVWVGNLARAYRYSGQNDKAAATYDRAISLALKAIEANPNNARILGSLGLYYAVKGDSKKALGFIRRARSIDGNANELIYKQALIASLAGQQPEALKTLREALQKGYSPQEAKNDPELKGLSSDPEFDKLMKEFGKAN